MLGTCRGEVLKLLSVRLDGVDGARGVPYFRKALVLLCLGFAQGAVAVVFGGKA